MTEQEKDALLKECLKRKKFVFTFRDFSELEIACKTLKRAYEIRRDNIAKNLDLYKIPYKIVGIDILCINLETEQQKQDAIKCFASGGNELIEKIYKRFKIETVIEDAD